MLSLTLRTGLDRSKGGDYAELAIAARAVFRTIRHVGVYSLSLSCSVVFPVSCSASVSLARLLRALVTTGVRPVVVASGWQLERNARSFDPEVVDLRSDGVDDKLAARTLRREAHYAAMDAACRPAESAARTHGAGNPSWNSNKAVLPLFGEQIIRDVAVQEGVEVLDADGEAAALVAWIAASRGGYAVTNDCDILCFSDGNAQSQVVSNLRVIFVEDLRITTGGNAGVSWRWVQPLMVADALGLQLAQMPMLATLTGNDFTQWQAVGPHQLLSSLHEHAVWFSQNSRSRKPMISAAQQELTAASDARFSLRVGPPLQIRAKAEIADLLSTRFGGQVVRVNFIDKETCDGEDESHVYVTFSRLDACHGAVQTLRSELRDVTSDEVRMMDIVVFGIAINNLPVGCTSEEVHAHVATVLGETAAGTFDCKMKDPEVTEDGTEPGPVTTAFCNFTRLCDAQRCVAQISNFELRGMAPTARLQRRTWSCIIPGLAAWLATQPSEESAVAEAVAFCADSQETAGQWLSLFERSLHSYQLHQSAASVKMLYTPRSPTGCSESWMLARWRAGKLDSRSLAVVANRADWLQYQIEDSSVASAWELTREVRALCYAVLLRSPLDDDSYEPQPASIASGLVVHEWDTRMASVKRKPAWTNGTGDVLHTTPDLSTIDTKSQEDRQHLLLSMLGEAEPAAVLGLLAQVAPQLRLVVIAMRYWLRNSSTPLSSACIGAVLGSIAQRYSRTATQKLPTLDKWEKEETSGIVSPEAAQSLSTCQALLCDVGWLNALLNCPLLAVPIRRTVHGTCFHELHGGLVAADFARATHEQPDISFVWEALDQDGTHATNAMAVLLRSTTSGLEDRLHSTTIQALKTDHLNVTPMSQTVVDDLMSPVPVQGSSPEKVGIDGCRGARPPLPAVAGVAEHRRRRRQQQPTPQPQQHHQQQGTRPLSPASAEIAGYWQVWDAAAAGLEQLAFGGHHQLGPMSPQPQAPQPMWHAHRQHDQMIAWQAQQQQQAHMQMQPQHQEHLAQAQQAQQAAAWAYGHQVPDQHTWAIYGQQQHPTMFAPFASPPPAMIDSPSPPSVEQQQQRRQQQQQQQQKCPMDP